MTRPPGAAPSRHVLVELDQIEALAPAWRSLARTSARTPFESPDWLLPWWRHYGTGAEPVVVTWWADDDLVGVAPLRRSHARASGLPVCELSFWGAPVRPAIPLRGWVDVLALEPHRSAVMADFARWLARDARPWDLLHYLRLPAGSTMTAVFAGARAWAHVSLTGVVDSVEYVLPLPSDTTGWHGALGSKAQHNVRTAIRGFERRHGGTFDLTADPRTASELVGALHGLMTARWGPTEAYFRRDPAFGSFAADAVRAMFEAGAGYAVVARDHGGIRACLITLVLNGTAVAILIGVTNTPEYRSLSLGKSLFYLAIDEAVARGAHEFNFLAAGEYKEAFWKAEPRTLASGLFGRGPVGRAVAASDTLRRRGWRALLPARR